MNYQIKVFLNLVIIFSVVLLAFIFVPAFRQELSYQISQAGRRNISSYADLQPVNTEFSIVIPKIKANSKIIANVDPSNKSIYLSALKKGVAHALGSDLPGGKENIYLFAHSTDLDFNVLSFNAVFYLLHNLENGDQITIYYLGRRYNYVVYEKKIVGEKEVEYLYKKYNQSHLTLQTCWPPGTTLQRLLIFAKPKSVYLEGK